MSHPRLPYQRRGHADPVAGAPALTVRGLSVAYPGASRPALGPISLDVPRGARVALIGHNGSGKSTLLKAVAGLLAPAGGEIRIFGNPVGACHHRVAYLPQRNEVDWQFPITVERLVLAGRYVHRGWLARPGQPDRARVRSALDRLDLGPLAGRQIGQLSGGQQQRALLARALVQDAELLLLDEPLNAVDQATRAAVTATLAELAAGGRSLVVATHDLDRVDADFDAVHELRDGCRVELPRSLGEAAAWAG